MLISSVLVSKALSNIKIIIIMIITILLIITTTTTIILRSSTSFKRKNEMGFGDVIPRSAMILIGRKLIN